MNWLSKDDAYHRAFGKHSNIPDCCIDFWLTEWLTVFQDDGSGWKHPYARAVNSSKWGYVPCPECLGEGNRIKVKDCSIECGGEHRKDFKNKP
jgi:hypothetical protein